MNLEWVSNLILICAGPSGWPGDSHWPAWSPLGQDRNWPVSGELINIKDNLHLLWFLSLKTIGGSQNTYKREYSRRVPRMIEPCSDITSGSTWCWRDNHCLPCHSATFTTTGVNAHLDQQNSTQQTNQAIVKSTNNRAKPGSNHQNSSPPMLLLLHSLHNSSNHSLPLQTVRQQGRQIQCVKIST